MPTPRFRRLCPRVPALLLLLCFFALSFVAADDISEAGVVSVAAASTSVAAPSTTTSAAADDSNDGDGSDAATASSVTTTDVASVSTSATTPSTTTTAASADSSDSDSADTVAAAQSAMAVANANILRNRRPNEYILSDKASPNKLSTSSNDKAPPLDPSAHGSDKHSPIANAAASTDGDEDTKLHAYTVPDALASAASAAASAPAASADDYASIVEGLRKKFRATGNDTNRQAQVMQAASGFLGGLITPGVELGTVEAIKRATSTKDGDDAAYWMETLLKGTRGWRNVKDYGAAGDGTTDDTAAIQKALSDDRSEGHAVTVYLPAGRYLVSSSLSHPGDTELLGDALHPPSVIASGSFLGLGVITAAPLLTRQTAWSPAAEAPNRSIRNVVVDIRGAPADAYVTGVHWQSGRGTSLENIVFVGSAEEDAAQIGLFVENGQGGAASDLVFVGGRYGMVLGHQQFAAAGLYFSGCAGAAVQMLWDWGLGIRDVAVESCGAGIEIVDALTLPTLVARHGNNGTISSGNSTTNSTWMGGGARVSGQGRPWSTLQRNKTTDDTSSSAVESAAGSLSFVDVRFLDTKTAINATLRQGQTSLLLSNAAFSGVTTALHDASASAAVLTGDTSIGTLSYGTVYDGPSSSSTFSSGTRAEGPARDDALVVSAAAAQGNAVLPQRVFFRRARPAYAALDPHATQMLSARDFGAKGDGKADDTAALNIALDVAANMSAVVVLPAGTYLVSGTVNVPVGSRIVGQAWPEIRIAGDGFKEAANGQLVPGIRVGRPGEVGVVEMQGVSVVTSGEAAGAVVMEWNVKQSSQGAAGLWDIQLGGDSSALLLHVAPDASAYMDNLSLGASSGAKSSGHARGLLLESKGPSWLWGVSASGSLYQYSFFGAQSVVAGQLLVSPASSSSNSASLAMPGDPASEDKDQNAAIRLSNVASASLLGVGALGTTHAAPQLFTTSDSKLVSASNVNSNAASDSSTTTITTSSGNSTTLHRRANETSPATSLLAVTLAAADAPLSYVLWDQDTLDATNATGPCKSVMMAPVACHNYTMRWRNDAEVHGSLGADLMKKVCVDSCAASLRDRAALVDRVCRDWTFDTGVYPSLPLRSIYYGLNETCFKSKDGKYCNDVIAAFTPVDEPEDMPTTDMCSECWVGRLTMMQASPLSAYAVSPVLQRSLALVNARCHLSLPTNPQPPPEKPPVAPDYCASNAYHTVAAGENCTAIALQHGVSSADLINGNRYAARVANCTAMPVGAKLCLPPACDTYRLVDGDTCDLVASKTHVSQELLMQYNDWLDFQCSNLQGVRPYLGSVMCISPPGGAYVPPTGGSNSTGPGGGTPPGGGTGQAPPGTGYSTTLVDPPAGAPVGDRTTLNCGAWHVAQKGDTCDALQLANGVAAELLLETNQSLHEGTCDADLVPGTAYCVSPLSTWNTAVSFAYHDLGCWTQPNKDQRVLWEYYTRYSRDMTVKLCAEACLLSGYPFFGLVDSNGCYCDHGLTKGSVKGDGCNLKCVGDDKESCGGSMDSNYMNVWGYPKAVIMQTGDA